MANDWNRNKNVIHPRYNNGNRNYDIYAEDVANAIRKLGFKSEDDYEGNPFEQYRLDAVSSNGVIMTNNKFETTLSISLYLNNINITERMASNFFKWVRVSNNEESDKEWNNNHINGAKEIQIISNDILQDTVFHCAYVSEIIEDDENIYDNIFNVPFNSILATASISISNQIPSAELIGNLNIEEGEKNQIYTTGLPVPYNPDWSVNNLVIKPYCIASTITKIDEFFKTYNPDLFDLNEYPDFTDPQYYENGSPYINNIRWLIRKSSGEEINIEEGDTFSFEYKGCNDKRFLVIKNNFLNKDSFITIICKYTYNDPFTNMAIPKTYAMDLSCISTGQGTEQLLINNVFGTSIHNSDPAYIELFATYFTNGIEDDIQNYIEDPTSQSSIQWYKRSSSEDSWILLDAVTQDQNELNTDVIKCYEIRRYTSINSPGSYTTEKTYSARGGFLLRIYPALIKSSDVIKAVFINSKKVNGTYTATEIVYDTTDAIQAYITSSAGDKLYKDIDNSETTLTCMINYQGQLLENGDPRYGDNGELEGLFEYYWFKMSQDGTQTYNIFKNYGGVIQMQKVTDNTVLIPTSRSINIKAQHIDDLNMFQCIIVNKKVETNTYSLKI